MVLDLGKVRGSRIELEEAIENLTEHGFDADDCESLDTNARMLAGLAENRDFLAETMVQRLKGEYSRDNMVGYSGQVIEVAAAKGYLIRAVIWPGENDRIYKASGKMPFVFDLAHDHDFHFLTTGYFGPGYWSRHFTQDPAENTGVVGAPAPLVPQGELQLGPGDVHLYRAHVDIHAQLPAPSLSVSLNFLQSGLECGWSSQYSYDLNDNSIKGVLNGSSNESLLYLLPHLDGQNGRDLVEEFAKTHYSERVRMRAWEALALALPGEAPELWQRAARDPAPMVAQVGRKGITAKERLSV